MRNSAADEPHEKCEQKGNCVAESFSSTLVVSSCVFFFKHFIHSPSFTLLSLSLSLSPLLSALPSLSLSLSLSLLAQPAYPNWAGLDILTAQGEGLVCFQSITSGIQKYK